MEEKAMNDMAPWGKQWGHTSKRDYRNIVLNLAQDIEYMKAIVYMRDLLYNPVFDLENAVILAKGLNNYEV